MAKIIGIVHNFYLRTRLKNWYIVYSILYVEVIARIRVCNNWWLCKYIYETNLGFEPRCMHGITFLIIRMVLTLSDVKRDRKYINIFEKGNKNQ
jgi:hypothetical protein